MLNSITQFQKGMLVLANYMLYLQSTCLSTITDMLETRSWQLLQHLLPFSRHLRSRGTQYCFTQEVACWFKSKIKMIIVDSPTDFLNFHKYSRMLFQDFLWTAGSNGQVSKKNWGYSKTFGVNWKGHKKFIFNDMKFKFLVNLWQLFTATTLVGLSQLWYSGCSTTLLPSPTNRQAHMLALKFNKIRLALNT